MPDEDRTPTGDEPVDLLEMIRIEQGKTLTVAMITLEQIPNHRHLEVMFAYEKPVTTSKVWSDAWSHAWMLHDADHPEEKDATIDKKHCDYDVINIVIAEAIRKNSA